MTPHDWENLSRYSLFRWWSFVRVLLLHESRLQKRRLEGPEDTSLGQYYRYLRGMALISLLKESKQLAKRNASAVSNVLKQMRESVSPRAKPATDSYFFGAPIFSVWLSPVSWSL